MRSKTRVVISNEILNSPNWVGSHSPKWTRPQIWTWISGKILEKSLIFSEGKAWVSQLAQKRCPNLHAHSYCIKIDKIEKIRDHFHLHSFFYIKIIYLYLSLPGYSRMPYFQGFNEKPLGKQISKTNWWCVFHLWDNPKGTNTSFKSNWILISSLQGQMYH